MKKLSLLFGCLAASLGTALAQVPTRHLADAPRQALLRDAARTPAATLRLPAVAAADRRRQDEQAAAPGELLPVGRPLPVSVSLPAAGRWRPVPGGRTCRLDVASRGVVSLSFLFDKFFLPPGATLYLYSQDRSVAMGPLTAELNNRHHLYSTDLVPGEVVTLELFEPTAVTGQTELHLGEVVQNHRTVSGALAGARPTGGSLSCNVDVNCPTGNAWQNESNAVMLILTGSNSPRGTGVLLNDACQSLAPNVLTARHLIQATGSISEQQRNDLRTWKFRFRYKSTGCQGPDASDYLTFSGSQLLASHESSDFMLLQLNQRPKPGSGITYAGWNRLGGAPATGACLHHPAADAMRIAVYSQVAQPTPGHSNYWRANFSAGIVEPISSGAPLFDQNHQVVGTLTGDWDRPGTDYCQYKRGDYGRFDVAWTGGGTPETRLQDWLTADPNVVQVPGLNAIPTTTNPGQTCGPRTTLYTYLPCGDVSDAICTDQCVPYGATPATIRGRISADEGNERWGDYDRVMGGKVWASAGEHEWVQWQVSYDNQNWSDISGAIEESYSPGPLTRTTYYRRVSTHLESNWYGGKTRRWWYNSNVVVLTSGPAVPSPAPADYRTCGFPVAVTVSQTPNTSTYNWWVPYPGWTVNDGNSSFSTYNTNSSFVTSSRSVTVVPPAGVAPGTYTIAVSANGACGPKSADATLRIVVSAGPGQTIDYAQWNLVRAEQCYTWYNITMPAVAGVTNYRAVTSSGHAAAGVLDASGTQVTFEVNEQGPQSNVSATISAQGDCGTIYTYLDPAPLGRRPIEDCNGPVQDRAPAPALYPNPAANRVTLTNAGAADQVQLYDAHGLLRQTIRLTAGQEKTVLSLQGLPAGLYHVRIMRAGRALSSQQLTVEP